MLLSVPFKTEYAVSMTCQSCVDDISGILKSHEGVDSFDIDLANKTVLVEGRVPPSQVSRALKDTGRQVIVRGAGVAQGEHDSAAVCIFEAHTPLNIGDGSHTTPAESALTANPDEPSLVVHGVARLVQVTDDGSDLCLLDITVRHEAFRLATSSSKAERPRFGVYIARSGNLTNGALSTGGVHRVLGELDVDSDWDDGAANSGKKTVGATGVHGDLFLEVRDLRLWEVIGRGMVVAPIVKGRGTELEFDGGILAGVIARSAGVWGNEKTVCSCSGMSMWEENRLAPNL